VQAVTLLKLGSYGTEVHKISKLSSQIIEDESFEIRIAIFHSV